MTHQEPTPAPRFLVDAMLGHVARDLRLLGFDARFAPDLDDSAVLGLAQREGLCLVTCDAALARRAGPLPHVRVHSRDREGQVGEVLRSLPRSVGVAPFARCLACNGPLHRLSGGEGAHLVPDHVAWTAKEVWQCRTCRRTYWHGTHVPHLQRRVRHLIGLLRAVGPGRA